MYKRHRIAALENETAQDLDLPENLSLTLLKSVEELNDVNNIKRGGALGIELPMTPKNDRIFERFRSPSIVDNYYDPVQVETWVNSNRLDLTKLEVLESDEIGGTFEISINDGNVSWHEAAEATKLRDLDLGNFVFSVAAIEANQQFNTRWEPGDDVLWCPLLDTGDGGQILQVKAVDPSANEIAAPGNNLPVGSLVELQFIVNDGGVPPGNLSNGGNYLFEVKAGGKLTPVGITITTEGNGDFFIRLNRWKVRHIRPLFSILGLLKTAFAEIGYSLDGEILQTEYIQRLWAYILAPDFYDNDGNKNLVRMTVENTVDQTILNPGGALLFDNVIEDGNGSFLPGGAYQNNTGETIKITISLTGVFENTSTSVANFNIVLTSSVTAFQETKNFVVQPSSTEVITFEKEVTIYPGEWIGFLAGAVSPPNSIIFKSGSTYSVELSEVKFILTGADTPLNQLLHPDYTVMDLLKGFMHLGDFKLKTSIETKTVTVYPAEQADVHGAMVEGFLREISTVKDMSGRIEKDSRKITARRGFEARYFRLQFKNSTDVFIRERLNLPKDSPLHSRTVDLGIKFKADETKEVTNPFFEATAEHRAGGVTAPALWDNDKHEPSFKIGPRVFYSVGWIEQRFSAPIEFDGNPTQINISHYFFEGTEKTFMPYASQLPGVSIWDGSSEYLPSQNVVYGSQSIDLFTMFWNKSRIALSILPTFSFLVRMSLDEYLAEDFRTRWFIPYKGQPYVYRLSQLRDHETGNDGSTIAVLIPEPNFTGL